ncbi:MAG TPA: glycosyltransferase family 2 protein [Armatimonadota bacterium]|nr:glycosyltransferase family 2 protein [Armatimonadota bacterium]
MDSEAPYLSIVVPVYNEEENLNALQEQLNTALASLGKSYEIIYVDDGSRDLSFSVLQTLAVENPQARVIRFRRNYGQTAAMAAGFDSARGEVIIPLDADRQNDPQDIPRLLAKLNEGYDVVSGWRQKRQDKAITRKLPSRMANALISLITGVQLHDYGCTLKAYRASILKDVRLYGEMHRFIPALAALEGARVTELPVHHHPRVAGKAKYGLSRTFRVFLDLLVVRFLGGYGTKPIHLFGGMGISLCGAGIAAGLLTLYQKIWLGVKAHRNPLLMLAVFLFILGVQAIMMGLLAELSIRIYHESQGRPTYRVAELLNFTGEAQAAVK